MSIKDIIARFKTLHEIYYMYPIVDDNNPAPILPYLVIVPSADYIYADNKNYLKLISFTLEFYFKHKNEADEALIESTLIDLGFSFERSEDTRIDDVFVIYYYV